MYYNEKLENIRKEKDIKQKEIANILGIKQPQYSRYEKGINEMPISMLKPICEYLEISADWLLDIKTKSKEKEYHKLKKEILEKIKKLEKEIEEIK